MKCLYRPQLPNPTAHACNFHIYTYSAVHPSKFSIKYLDIYMVKQMGLGGILAHACIHKLLRRRESESGAVSAFGLSIHPLHSWKINKHALIVGATLWNRRSESGVMDDLDWWGGVTLCETEGVKEWGWGDGWFILMRRCHTLWSRRSEGEVMDDIDWWGGVTLCETEGVRVGWWMI